MQHLESLISSLMMSYQFLLKWVNRSMKQQSLFPLGAAVLCLVLGTGEVSASAGTETLLASTSWSNDDSRSSRSSYSAQGSSNETSPFSPGSNNIGIDLGQIFLVGDLTRFQNSLGFQIHYDYGVSDLFSFDSSLGYSQHSLGPASGGFSILSLLSGLRMNLSWYDRIIPFGVVGLGFYLPSYVDLTATPTRTTTSSSTSSSGTSNLSGLPSISALLFGLHFGAGVDLSVSKNVFFGSSLTFHQMFGTTQQQSNGTPLNLGGAYLSFLLHVGGTF